MKNESRSLEEHLIENYVREIYNPFTADQISAKIAQMLKTETINADINVIFQSIENLAHSLS